jgi:hypothetical protein
MPIARATIPIIGNRDTVKCGVKMCDRTGKCATVCVCTDVLRIPIPVVNSQESNMNEPKTEICARFMRVSEADFDATERAALESPFPEYRPTSFDDDRTNKRSSFRGGRVSFQRAGSDSGVADSYLDMAEAFLTCQAEDCGHGSREDHIAAARALLDCHRGEQAPNSTDDADDDADPVVPYREKRSRPDYVEAYSRLKAHNIKRLSE